MSENEKLYKVLEAAGKLNEPPKPPFWRRHIFSLLACAVVLIILIVRWWR